MSNKVSVALVDDHKILVDGIESLLSVDNNLNVIIKEQSGEDLLLRSDLNKIDLLIMDINMDGLDGIQVLKQLRAKSLEFYCILLSSYDDLKLVNEAMKNGANGYVTKGSATEYLEQAISQVLDGGRFYSPDIEQRILRSFSKKPRNKNNDSREQSLLRHITDREMEVLKLIALEYTSDEIAKRLFVAKSTVDSHRKKLISKLKVKNAVGLGIFAARHKLV